MEELHLRLGKCSALPPHEPLCIVSRILLLILTPGRLILSIVVILPAFRRSSKKMEIDLALGNFLSIC